MWKKKDRWLTLESLEDRLAPAVFGVPWPDAQHLTLSFAPDGTAVGDRPSELFRLLDRSFPGSTWQREILRAAQTWVVEANLNIGLIQDEGPKFGFRGSPQGDAQAGDIRFSAVPMSPEVIGIGSPYDVTAGTWAGDVRLNSNYTFGHDTSDTQVDLFSVALHELGHALGLDHDLSDPASAMYGKIATHSTLTTNDLSALRALYGEREPDSFDAGGRFNNDTLAQATPVSLGNLTRTVLEADLTTHTDVDVYEFRPGQANAVTVQLQTAGLSLLAPRLTILDDSHRIVGTAVATEPGGDLTITLENVKHNDTFFVQVEAASRDLFGIGGYRLALERTLHAPLGVGLNGPRTTPLSNLLNDDLHTNDTLDQATNLNQRVFDTDPRSDYLTVGSLSDAQDVDFYRLRSPRSTTGAQQVLQVSLWGIQNELDLRTTLFDALGRPVAVDVLVNDGKSFTLQIANAASNVAYYLRVGHAAGSSASQGNYLLAADFNTHAVDLPQLVAGALDAGHAHESYTLTITESQLYHLILAGSSLSGSPDLRLTVTTEIGDLIETMILPQDGTATSATVFLTPGTYGFRFEGPEGQLFAPFLYTLHGVSLSDPIGPQLADTTTDPVGPSPAAQPAAGTSTTPSTPQYYPGRFVSVQEAYSDPVLPIQPGPVAGLAGGAGTPSNPLVVGLVIGTAPLTVLTAPTTTPAPTATAELPGVGTPLVVAPSPLAAPPLPVTSTASLSAAHSVGQATPAAVRVVQTMTTANLSGPGLSTSVPHTYMQLSVDASRLLAAPARSESERGVRERATIETRVPRDRRTSPDEHTTRPDQAAPQLRLRQVGEEEPLPETSRASQPRNDTPPSIQTPLPSGVPEGSKVVRPADSPTPPSTQPAGNERPASAENPGLSPVPPPTASEPRGTNPSASFWQVLAAILAAPLGLCLSLEPRGNQPGLKLRRKAQTSEGPGSE